MTLDSDLRATYHLEGTSNPLYTNMASGKESLRQIFRAFETLSREPIRRLPNDFSSGYRFPAATLLLTQPFPFR